MHTVRSLTVGAGGELGLSRLLFSQSTIVDVSTPSATRPLQAAGAAVVRWFGSGEPGVGAAALVMYGHELTGFSTISTRDTVEPESYLSVCCDDLQLVS
ncbi:hypothetical protein HYH02_014842 [Chlamydomonas schloesseri]|uniref:Uncharacterized protein n=1 Tax=Chlamydomonas schloesseri TaxID=2026947 RepID=A0A835SF81_9CHLO|nr:hypothetical protein HYH02_014842 [Chlamydomonas schloesseri]|eukprot:KAG2426127.1 hypothetical protein HYH02_014842 [Chlamydomonas schloesseri]